MNNNKNNQAETKPSSSTSSWVINKQFLSDILTLIPSIVRWRIYVIGKCPAEYSTHKSLHHLKYYGSGRVPPTALKFRGANWNLLPGKIVVFCRGRRASTMERKSWDLSPLLEPFPNSSVYGLQHTAGVNPPFSPTWSLPILASYYYHHLGSDHVTLKKAFSNQMAPAAPFTSFLNNLISYPIPFGSLGTTMIETNLFWVSISISIYFAILDKYSLFS
jgi:hypothetical protein